MCPPLLDHSLASCSRLIAQNTHCPEQLRRSHWSQEQFELRKKVYEGQNSLVFHAIDRRSGISIALKAYRRARLNDIERFQVGGRGLARLGQQVYARAAGRLAAGG